MALKKSQLYSSLWQICDELRGGMDASQYKDYVLTLLFMKYVIEGEAKAAKAVKEAQARLDEQVLARYGALTETEIKTLAVEDKWFASIRGAIEGEVQRLTQQLAGRVEELEERYARPLPELEREVEVFGAKVEEHLKRMGLTVDWGAVR